MAQANETPHIRKTRRALSRMWSDYDLERRRKLNARDFLGWPNSAKARASAVSAGEDIIELLSHEGHTWGRNKHGEIVTVIDGRVQKIWP